MTLLVMLDPATPERLDRIRPYLPPGWRDRHRRVARGRRSAGGAGRRHFRHQRRRADHRGDDGGAGVEGGAQMGGRLRQFRPRRGAGAWGAGAAHHRVQRGGGGRDHAGADPGGEPQHRARPYRHPGRPVAQGRAVAHLDEAVRQDRGDHRHGLYRQGAGRVAEGLRLHPALYQAHTRWRPRTRRRWACASRRWTICCARPMW